MKTISNYLKGANYIWFKISIIFLVFIFSVTFYSCQKSEYDQQLTANSYIPIIITQDDSLKIAFLHDTFGFQFENFEVTKESIIAEGDIVFDRSNFWTYYVLQKDTLSQSKTHRRSLSMVTKISSIQVVVDGTIDYAWKVAIGDACNEWNNLNGRIKFVTVSSSTPNSTGINFKKEAIKNADGSANTLTVARGSVVASGYPGHMISLNTYYTKSLTASRKKAIIVHEIGHNIGFFHTDSSDGYRILGISDTFTTDYSSIMQASVGSWLGFSKADKEAFYMFYK